MKTVRLMFEFSLNDFCVLNVTQNPLYVHVEIFISGNHLR